MVELDQADALEVGEARALFNRLPQRRVHLLAVIARPNKQDELLKRRLQLSVIASSPMGTQE